MVLWSVVHFAVPPLTIDLPCYLLQSASTGERERGLEPRATPEQLRTTSQARRKSGGASKVRGFLTARAYMHVSR